MIILLWLLAAGAQAAPCQPAFERVLAAPELQQGVRPVTGWAPVTLPDTWKTRWPQHQGAVWYQLQWRYCGNEALALAVNHITMAASIYVNDTLLWRDVHLEEPYSRSWNLPRYWVLPEAALHPGRNQLWFRVVGMPYDNLGLGQVSLGAPAQVWPLHQNIEWRQRHLFVLNLTISLVLGFLFLSLWLAQPQDSAFGWLALASFAWALLDYTMLATSPWPFVTSADWNRWVVSLFAFYTFCFCLFVWRFGEQPFRRLIRWLLLLLLLSLLALWMAPEAALNDVLVSVGLVFSLVFVGNCLQFQFHAWRHPRRHNVLLALCLLVFLLVCLHDLAAVVGVLEARLYTPVSSPVMMVVMFLIIADRFASSRRRIEMFNRELQQAVESSRAELTRTLGQQHELALYNTRLTARLNLIHDLHDGLGGSLMRAIALVERGSSGVTPGQFLAMLKELRNDLRQIIDNSSETASQAEASPARWLAPLRHRFVRLFEELGVVSHWRMPPDWPCPLTSRQQLSLARFLEEALTNAIKHSGANRIDVSMTAYGEAGLALCVQDNGNGIDPEALEQGGGIGMHSMHARAARMGGKLVIDSCPGTTSLSLYLTRAG